MTTDNVERAMESAAISFGISVAAETIVGDKYFGAKYVAK